MRARRGRARAGARRTAGAAASIRGGRLRRAALFLVVVTAGTSLGCAAPFSSQQSAALVGPGEWEATPFYSATRVSSDEESGMVQGHLGVQATWGAAPWLDLQGRYEWIRLRHEDRSLHVVGAGPKLRLVRDRLAVVAPTGVAFGTDGPARRTLQTHPGLVATLPLHPRLELNASGKALVPINDREVDTMVAFTLGLGAGPVRDRWVVRPEVGLLRNPGESGRFLTFTLGVSYDAAR